MRSNALIAHDGDTLEGVIWREARLGPAALPAVFAANPGLCERLTLSAGEIVKLPPAVLAGDVTQPQTSRVNLWD
jgi:phage tail protein X